MLVGMLELREKYRGFARWYDLAEGLPVTCPRSHGETASEKANELMLHLAIATVSVTILIWLFLGWRGALVVLVAVPVTLALTLFAYYALGYTLNRITLFALIFSIGILVDDAIVVVENIYRHLLPGYKDPETAAVEGVDEVGNPTILATFTVIAAILPMAFVSGLMGPYMRPIPVGASVAMLAWLGVAFVVTPYRALRLLRGHVSAPAGGGAGHDGGSGGRFGRLYARLMTGLMGAAGATGACSWRSSVRCSCWYSTMPLREERLDGSDGSIVTHGSPVEAERPGSGFPAWGSLRCGPSGARERSRSAACTVERPSRYVRHASVTLSPP
jgi:multidrug efflux pump subunit AcrB